MASTFACVNKTVPARLYDLSSAEVIEAKFNFRGKTEGVISFALPSGEAFKGEYRTLPAGSRGWGTVFYAGGYATTVVRLKPDRLVGAAVVTSDKGRVIECEYVTNTSRFTPHGSGVCRDNNGIFYRLMF